MQGARFGNAGTGSARVIGDNVETSARKTARFIAARSTPRCPWIWNFSKNIPAAKSLLAYLTMRENQEKLVNASSGFDLPPFASFLDFKAWEQVEPPRYTVYNFPPRRDVIPHLTGYPAPLKIGTQIYAQATMMKMIAQVTQSGKSVNDVINWAASELEGFMRS